jgi:dynein heavy chain
MLTVWMCGAGCWGCLDDLSRVEFRDISVAAQQMSTILFAKRARAKNFVLTDGDNGSLDSNAAFFMTMLPSSELLLPLPENMKTHLRGIMMIAPDIKTIVRVKLTAAGYAESTALAKKVTTLYEMCVQCLSQQVHYDFGLRNVCSLISSCWHLKRTVTDIEMTESEMIVRILKEQNMPSLAQEDSIIFLDLVETLFPGVSGKKLENVKQGEILRAICDNSVLEYDAIPAIRT